MLTTKNNAIIKNSWYCMEKELKKLLIFSIVNATICMILSYFFDNLFFIVCCIGVLISASVTDPLSVIKKDTSSQWDKFMHTLPITRNDIVNSQFRFIEQLTLLYVVFISILSYIALKLNIGVDLQIVCNLIIITISVGIVGQSLLYTNSLKSKDVTSDNFISFILITSASVGLIPMQYIDIYGSKNHEYGLIFHIVIALLLIISIEFICYLLCKKYINEKEF